MCPTPSRYVGRTLSASKEMCSLPHKIPLRARSFQPRNAPRIPSVMFSTQTYPICIGKAVRKPRRYAQGGLLVAMSPHIGRDTQNIAHSHLGKQSSLFRPGDCSPTMPIWPAGGKQADLGRYTRALARKGLQCRRTVRARGCGAVAEAIGRNQSGQPAAHTPSSPLT